jgi:hypothetical protein
MSKRRRLWRPGSGLGLLLLLTVGAAVLTMVACMQGNDPLALSTGGCNCSPPNSACCVAHHKCCDPAYPHHCAETSKCYKYFTDAQQACGNNYEICGGPVGVASPAPLDADDGLPEARAVADQACFELE